MKEKYIEGQEELDYIRELETQLEEQNGINKKLHSAQMSLFGTANDENLIKWQLDLREDLERIYHLLRGDEIKEDEKGNTFYVPPQNDESKPFNEFGVQVIMNIMSFYLNRNTILSNYDTETINWKVYDFGLELSDLIFNRYEEMMMTTTFEKEFKRIYSRNLIEYKNSSYGILVKVNGKKKMVPISEKMVAIVNKRLDEHLLGKMKMYPMIVRELVDSVHSA